MIDDFEGRGVQDREEEGVSSGVFVLFAKASKERKVGNVGICSFLRGPMVLLASFFV